MKTASKTTTKTRPPVIETEPDEATNTPAEPLASLPGTGDGVATDQTSEQPVTISPADPTTGAHNRAPRSPSIDWSDERLVTLVTTINQLKADNGASPTAEDVATALQSNDQFADIAALVTPQKVSSQLRAVRRLFPDRQIPTLSRKVSGGRGKRDLSALEALLPPLDTGETQDAEGEDDGA